MQRKLVKQGNGALTLTLPFKWVQRNSLSHTNYVSVVDSGNALLITTRKSLDTTSHEIIISRKAPFFKRYLFSLYVLGHTDVTINTIDIDLPIDEINEALSLLIGFEIVSLSQKKCVINAVASAHQHTFDTVFRRIFFILDTMFQDIVQVLEMKKQYRDNTDFFKKCSHIIAMERSVDSFVFFCQRLLTIEGYTDFNKTPYLYQVLSHLEQIGDTLRDFVKEGIPLPNTFGAIQSLYIYFKELQHLFFKYDSYKIKSVKQHRMDLFSLLANTSSYGEHGKFLFLLLSLLHQFEVVLNPLNS